MSLPDDLAKLVELHANGQLTDDEYAAAKKRLLEPGEAVPEGVPIATPVPPPPAERPGSPWETAVIESHDGMSDAYWKAKYRRSLSLVTAILFVVALFSVCGSCAMGFEGAGVRSERRPDWERIAMVTTAVLWALSTVGICIWSFSDPFRAGIGAIAVILLVGVLGTLFTMLDLEGATPDQARTMATGLLVGWILRLGLIAIVIWGVFDAQHIRRYTRNGN